MADAEDKQWISPEVITEVTTSALRLHILLEREKSGEAMGPDASPEIQSSACAAADAVLTKIKELGSEGGDELARRWGWSSACGARAVSLAACEVEQTQLRAGDPCPPARSAWGKPAGGCRRHKHEGRK